MLSSLHFSEQCDGTTAMEFDNCGYEIELTSGQIKMEVAL